MGRRRLEWRKMRADKPGLTVPQVNISLCELRPTLAHALDLPTLQCETGLEGVLDKVVMACPPINGDHVSSRFFGFLFAHESWVSGRR